MNLKSLEIFIISYDDYYDDNNQYEIIMEQETGKYANQ